MEATKPKKTITSQHSKFSSTKDKAAGASTAQKDNASVKADSTKLSKKKKKAKKDLTNKNIETAGKNAKKSNAERESKYAYPSDCKTAKEKKEFRRKARATAAAFDKDMKPLRKKTDPESVKAYEKLKKERTAFRKETYSKLPEDKTAE